jgi:hypothetical protein
VPARSRILAALALLAGLIAAPAPGADRLLVVRTAPAG